MNRLRPPASPHRTGASFQGRAGLRLILLLAALVLALLAGVLRWRGYRIILQRPHGDQTQSAPIRMGHLESLADLAPPPHGLPPERAVRNVVLVIADGLGFSHVEAARAQLVGLAGRLSFERLPVTGWVTTQSSDSLITDSAAAASSLATGEKVAVGALSVSADGRPLATLAEAASAAGMAVGLVTDSYLWDATPAAFAVHVPSRTDHGEIARQMARSGFTLLMGERAGHDDAGDGSLPFFRQQGYQVVDTWIEALPASPDPLVALLSTGSVDDPGQRPSLAELANFALHRLGARPGGFLLVLETEEADTGSHQRNLRRVTAGVAALDEAMRELVAFVTARDDTLLLLTADHETGGLTLVWGEEGKPLGIRWAGGHTGAPVPLYATGPGAERFAGVLDNTQIPERLAALLGLDSFGGGDVVRRDLPP